MLPAVESWLGNECAVSAQRQTQGEDVDASDDPEFNLLQELSDVHVGDDAETTFLDLICQDYLTDEKDF